MALLLRQVLFTGLNHKQLIYDNGLELIFLTWLIYSNLRVRHLWLYLWFSSCSSHVTEMSNREKEILQIGFYLPRLPSILCWQGLKVRCQLFIKCTTRCRSPTPFSLPQYNMRTHKTKISLILIILLCDECKDNTTIFIIRCLLLMSGLGVLISFLKWGK